MSLSVQPSVTFSPTCDGFATGLTGTIGVRIDQGASVSVARTTSGIVEYPASSGIYVATITAPADSGSYQIVWDDGGTMFAVEDLTVTGVATPPAGPVLPSAGMSGSQLIDEFLADDRFGQSRSRVLGFLNYRYEDLLGLESWSFLEGKEAVTLDSAVITDVPADMGLPRRLYLNDDGCDLAFLTLEDFERRYLGVTSTGRPEAWAVYAGTILVGPAPGSSYPATLLYDKDPADLEDGDVEPITPGRTHLGLVAGAQAFALELENDDSAAPLERRFQATVDGMRRRYLVTGRGQRRVMPRDPLFG